MPCIAKCINLYIARERNTDACTSKGMSTTSKDIFNLSCVCVCERETWNQFPLACNECVSYQIWMHRGQGSMTSELEFLIPGIPETVSLLSASIPSMGATTRRSKWNVNEACIRTFLLHPQWVPHTSYTSLFQYASYFLHLLVSVCLILPTPPCFSMPHTSYTSLFQYASYFLHLLVSVCLILPTPPCFSMPHTSYTSLVQYASYFLHLLVSVCLILPTPPCFSMPHTSYTSLVQYASYFLHLLVAGLHNTTTALFLGSCRNARNCTSACVGRVAVLSIHAVSMCNLHQYGIMTAKVPAL